MNNSIPEGRAASVSGVSALRRFAAPASTPAKEAVERCELCGEQLVPDHAHLVDLKERSICCSCTACGLLFDRPGARYRKVPDRVLIDPDSPLTEAEWAELRIPVSIAFFFSNSDQDRVVASYPSSAGVTECELDISAWDRLAVEHPLLATPEKDVEALLVLSGRSPGAAADASEESEVDVGEGLVGEGIETFLVPIDICYSLAGALRMEWHGFDGGPEVRKILTDFLADLRRRARPLASAPG